MAATATIASADGVDSADDGFTDVSPTATNALRGKKVVTIGDSQTSSGEWQQWLVEWLGVKWSMDETAHGIDGHRPMAVGGTWIRPNDKSAISLRAADARFYSPDTIIIYAGQNDVLSGWDARAAVRRTDMERQHSPAIARRTAAAAKRDYTPTRRTQHGRNEHRRPAGWAVHRGQQEGVETLILAAMASMPRARMEESEDIRHEMTLMPRSTRRRQDMFYSMPNTFISVTTAKFIKNNANRTLQIVESYLYLQREVVTLCQQHRPPNSSNQKLD